MRQKMFNTVFISLIVLVSLILVVLHDLPYINIYDIINELFALHINLQYKTEQTVIISWSRVTEVTVEFASTGQ